MVGEIERLYSQSNSYNGKSRRSSKSTSIQTIAGITYRWLTRFDEFRAGLLSRKRKLADLQAFRVLVSLPTMEQMRIVMVVVTMR
jgi:hypothetical protein